MAPDWGGRGSSKGQLTLFKTFKQLSHADYVSPNLMSLWVPEWNWVLLLKWEEQCVLFLYISFSNALITQDFTPMEYSPHLILLSAKSACTHHTLHATHTTLHSEYRTHHWEILWEPGVLYRGLWLISQWRKRTFQNYPGRFNEDSRQDGTFGNLNSNGIIF